jgi:hypothetical protein
VVAGGGGMTVTSNKQIAKELIISIQTSSTMTGHCQIRRIGLRACVDQAEFPPRLTWCPRNASRLSDGRTAHWT